MKKKIDINNVINLETGLTSGEKEARLTILNRMIAEKGPLDLECMEYDLKIMANKLIKKKKIVVEDNKVKFAYPVSGIQTAHRIILDDGRDYYAMCAIDSLGSSFTFHSDLTIESKCAVTGDPIYIKISDGEIVEYSPKSIQAIHVDLSLNTEWASSC